MTKVINATVEAFGFQSLVSAIEAEKAEIMLGVKTGSMLTIPMVTAFFSAKLLAPCQMDAPLVAIFMAQLLPAMFLSFAGNRLSKKTRKVLSIATVLTGISNGIIMSMIIQ